MHNEHKCIRLYHIYAYACIHHTKIQQFVVIVYPTAWLLMTRWSYEHVHEQPTKILTRWCRVTHICVGRLGHDNGLSSGRRQAIIWTNVGILIGLLGTNFNEIEIGIFEKAFENVIREIAAILSRFKCVKRKSPCIGGMKFISLLLQSRIDM